MSFWKELKRRNVYKVGVAYAIVAWLLIQFAAIAFPHLDFPEWTVPFVIVLLIIGFPLILLFAWAFEITPEGIKRTKEVPLAESITHLTGKKLNYILAGLLVIAVGYILVDKLYIAPRTSKTEQVSVSGEAVAKKTIAVLPFVNMSSDLEQEYFVDGLSEELLNTLAQIPDLTVIARTSSFSFKGTTKKVQEIANELGVDNILEGSVRKAGNDLRITAQLVKGVDGSHLWSKSYDRELKAVADILSIQEDIATAVANELKLTLGIGKSLKQLGGTENLEAYEQYLIAKALYREGPIAVSKALEPIEKAVALDPDFALAWALKSNIHCGIIEFITEDQRISVFETSLKAAQKAIELEPNLAAGYESLGIIKMWMGEWIEAETAFRKALERVAEPSLRYEVVHPFLYEGVGYLEKAKETYEGQLRNDPLNANKLNLYIYCLGLLGDRQGAEEEYERAIALFGDRWPFGDVHISCARFYAGGTVSLDEIPYSSTVIDVAKEHLESPEEAITHLRMLYSNSDKLAPYEIENISTWAAYFGDIEFAMDAMERAVGLMPSEVAFAWSPVMKDVRQLPRFKEFVREIGLVDYWNEFGWPDICRLLDNGDFECD